MTMINNTPARNAADRTPGGVRERFALFADWTGAPLFPFENMTEGPDSDRTFSTAFLRYCADYGMSIDWVWLGDERSLVLEAFYKAQEDRA